MEAEVKFQSYRDLKVWQAGMTLAEACYLLTKKFPREEVYGLISRIRGAAVSIPANMAEGYGRENRGEFIQFLRISQGSLKELEPISCFLSAWKWRSRRPFILCWRKRKLWVRCSAP